MKSSISSYTVQLCKMKVSSVSSIFISFFIISGIQHNVNAKQDSPKQQNVKISNGTEAKPNAFPYMVAVRTIIDGRDVGCGGSLITDSLVLTAARCLYGATEAEVIIGARDLENTDENYVQMTSNSFIIHEKYRNDSMQHDIAIIELESAVTLSDKIATVTLPDPTDIFKDYNGKQGVVAGWGKTGDTGTPSNVLLYADLTVIPNTICEISHAFQISLEQMCTSGVSQKNICLGDSGSPFVVDGVQIGIASFGSDFGCSVGFPGVYTRVSAYLSWLGVALE